MAQYEYDMKVHKTRQLAGYDEEPEVDSGELEENDEKSEKIGESETKARHRRRLRGDTAGPFVNNLIRIQIIIWI